MRPSDWNAKTNEDNLLQEYLLETAGGPAWMQVPVGKDQPRRSRRILDALRISCGFGEISGKWKLQNDDEKELWDLVSNASEIEVVEVKDQLGPRVIGQALAGKLLVENDLILGAKREITHAD